MDPITGISLAASIVQLVHFGISSAKAFQEIYQHGSTTEYTSADVTAGLLASLTNSVQQSLHNTKTQGTVLSAEEKELIDLARKCEDCVNKLQDELRKLQVQPQVSHLKAVRKAARSIWKKNAIIKIQEELEGYRRVLETSCYIVSGEISDVVTYKSCGIFLSSSVDPDGSRPFNDYEAFYQRFSFNFKAFASNLFKISDKSKSAKYRSSCRIIIRLSLC